MLFRSDVLKARLRAVLSVDVSAELRRVAVPILYLHATEDRVVPEVALRYIRRIRPDTRVVSIAAPHFLLQTRPEEAAQTVLDFVRQAG